MENKEIDTCKLLYNTERVKLYIPEYGRNVQKMVDYLKTIEDREKRNEQARAIIKVMEILNPSVHLQEDFEHKLWDHLFIISGFDLDVDAPYCCFHNRYNHYRCHSNVADDIPEKSTTADSSERKLQTGKA